MTKRYVDIVWSNLGPESNRIRDCLHDVWMPPYEEATEEDALDVVSHRVHVGELLKSDRINEMNSMHECQDLRSSKANWCTLRLVQVGRRKGLSQTAN